MTSITSTAEASWLRVAKPLPQWALTLALAAVPLGKRGRNDRLRTIAASCQIHGWAEDAWLGLIELGPLATAVRYPRGTDRAPITEGTYAGVMHAHWTDATRWREAHPAWSREEVAACASWLADRATEAAGDPDEPLTDDQRTVLLFAASEARRRGMLRVTLPMRDVAAAIAAGRKPDDPTPNAATAGRALKRLRALGLLSLHKRGDRHRASIYWLMPRHRSGWVDASNRYVGIAGTNTYVSPSLGPTYVSPDPLPTYQPATTEREAMPLETITRTTSESVTGSPEAVARYEALMRQAAAEAGVELTQPATVLPFRPHAVGEGS